MARQQRWLFITHSRSCSNLLMRIINSKQDGIKHTSYNFGLDAYEMLSTFYKVDINSLSAEEQEGYRKRYEIMAQQLRDHFDVVEYKDQIVTCKEQASFIALPEVTYENYQEKMDFLADPESKLKTLSNDRAAQPRNITCIDEKFLKSVTPIFLIRHPALTTPSYIRIFDFMSAVTWKYSREMYDWYCSNMPELGSPIIIDAMDCLNHPDILRQLVAKMGLDPDKLAFSWAAATKEEIASMPPAVYRMQETLAPSTGIVKEKLRSEIDIDSEAEKWQKEFGEEKARKMKLLVEQEMGDYNYLMERRLTVEKP